VAEGGAIEHCALGSGDAVTVGVVVRDGVGVTVRVLVGVTVGVRVRVREGVAVGDGLCVGGTVDDRVVLGVAVNVTVRLGVDVRVAVTVTVRLDVRVAEGVAVRDTVRVGVTVAVGVTVRVTVRVGLMVGVSVGGSGMLPKSMSWNVWPLCGMTRSGGFALVCRQPGLCTSRRRYTPAGKTNAYWPFRSVTAQRSNVAALHVPLPAGLFRIPSPLASMKMVQPWMVPSPVSRRPSSLVS
jgi:hypothetical protein